MEHVINYKGIYADDVDDGPKYFCPQTGAHFETNDLCRKLTKVMTSRMHISD